MSASRLAQVLSNKIVLLDGGLSTEITNLGDKITFQGSENQLWTGECILRCPDTLRKAHMNFIENGAQIIITASYQINIDNIAKYKNLSVEESKDYIKKSVEIAKQAREQCNRPDVLIAGSIGPYGATKNDFSEYTGNYTDALGLKYLMEWHRPRLECLIEAGCDLIAFETIPSIKEAHALVELLREHPTIKAWLSFSCKDGTYISNGDRFSDAYKEFSSVEQLVAIGINCSHPWFITSLLESVLKVSEPSSKPFVVYTNDESDIRTQSHELIRQGIDWNKFELSKWFELGVKFIGGCCNIDSSDIKRLEEIIKKY